MTDLLPSQLRSQALELLDLSARQADSAEKIGLDDPDTVEEQLLWLQHSTASAVRAVAYAILGRHG